MTPNDELKLIAKSLMWWQEPEVSLARPARFLMQVMTLGTWKQVKTVGALFGWEAFKNALEQAEPGVFDKQSWALWHNAFGLSAPELPKRSFLKEFGL
jgi:hypothetical protein